MWNMRTIGPISIFVITSLFSVYACTFESAPDPDKAASVTSALGISGAASPSLEQPTADESLGTVSSDATINPLSGCAHVLWCDNPSPSIGTDCQQDGCSRSSAESECLTDTAALGCNLHYPVVLRNSAGTIIAEKILCGGTSCWGDPDLVYCGLRGACCDGIHFSSACPP